MLKPGSRLGGAVFAVTGLFIADARLALAQEQTQEGIQEVVVTAERRQENLQTTPIAITALSAETLDKAQVSTFAGVAEQSTSINFTPYPSSSNTLILYMRGQGVADANQITQDGSVGLYEDGFYISRPQAETFDLADVDRVEILRGPQGTLYGRNTTGGAVNIISQKPTGEFGVKFSVDGGQRDYVRALGTVNLPTVAGGLSSKFTLLYTNLAGNVQNSGGEDFNRENQKGGRASLRWDTGGMFTADYFFEVGEIDSTPIYYQDPALAGLIPNVPQCQGGGNVPPCYPPTVGLAPNTWEPIPLPISEARFNADGLTLNFKLNDATTLRSLTYYRGLDSRFYQDYAGAFTNPAGAAVEGITNFTGYDIVQSTEFTQELQLIGNITKSVDYVAGLYYFDEHANHAEFGNINIPREFIPGIPIFNENTTRYVTADSLSKAAYAQASWKITEPLTLTLGGRYTKDNRDATRNATTNELLFNPPPGIPFLCPSPPDFQCAINAAEVNARNSKTFSKFNGSGSLALQLTPDINTYLRIASGYKAGGSSEAGPLGSFGQTFNPENVTTYELGFKSYWLEHRVRANIALFHSQFSQMQLQFDVDPTNLAIVQSYNAGSAKVNGAEFEFLFAPTNDLTIGLNDTVLSTDISSVIAQPGTIFDPAVNPASPYKVGQNVAPLFRLPYAPNNIVNGNVDWTMLHANEGNLELFVNYRYQGREYDTATTGVNVPASAQYYSIPAYGLMESKLTWNFNTHDSKKTMRFSLWCKNCTNKQYQEHVIGQGAAPFVPLPGVPLTGYTYQAVAWAPKFQFGAQFQYGF
jgi:iron complex outermembrane receptor protein